MVLTRIRTVFRQEVPGRRHDSRGARSKALAPALGVALLVVLVTPGTAMPGSIWAPVARETAALLDQAAKAA